MKNDICIIGCGFVGLSLITFIENGFNIIGLDNNQNKVDELNNGICSIKEENLDIFLKSGLNNNQLKFTTNAEEALSKANYVFICLPTPTNFQTGETDLWG